MATILNSAIWIQPCCTKLWLNLIQTDSNSFPLTELDDGSHLEFCLLQFSHFAQKNLNLIILTQRDDGSHLQLCNLGIQPFCTKKLHSCILTQIDDGSHLEFCHHGFFHFAQKRSSLIHSDSTWWWQPSWILPSWIQPFCSKLWLQLIQSDSKSFILTQLDDGSHLEFFLLQFSHFAQKNLNLIILTQSDDGSHPELCHVGFRHCHLGFKHLVIFSQIHSKTLSLHSDSDFN